MGGKGERANDRANDRASDEFVVKLVRASALPVGLVDVDSLRFRAISEHAAEILGVEPDYAGDVLDLTAEPEATRNAIDLMRRGIIDAYEPRGGLRDSDADTLKSTP